MPNLRWSTCGLTGQNMPRPKWSTTVDLLGGGVGADDQPPVACGQHPVRHVDAEPGPALEHLADVLRAQVQPAGEFGLADAAVGERGADGQPERVRWPW